MSIRSFVALSIPKNMANALGDAAAKMAYQDKSNAVRWVDQQNYHITLAFLGDQEEHALEQLAEHLDESLPHCGVNLAISHCSPFPESKPKLIAAMVAPNNDLRDLQQRVLSAVVASNMSLDKRRFVPHITLGRFRHSKNSFAGAIPRTIELLGLADEVAIFESELTPQGAEYQAMFRFPLEPFSFTNSETEFET